RASAFTEHMSREFTSKVVRQLQRQLESRDDRGRPLIIPRDAKLIADMARTAIASFAVKANPDSHKSRFTDSPTLRPLIAAASRRVLDQRVEKFDSRQPEHFLP